MSKRTITAQDLYRFELIRDVRISPDGKWVAYVVQRVDRKSEKKFSNLWLAPTDGGRPRQFTVGDQVDTSPRWSPDGKTIAFLSNRGDEKQMQIYLIPVDGGEARPLTDLQGQFGDFAWSPDGKRLVLEFRKLDPDAQERRKDERKRKLGVVARHITRVFYKLDGEGYLPKEQWHLWTVNTRTGRAKQLTDGEIHAEWGPVWSPDGQTIAFLSNRQPDPDLDPDAIDIFLIPAEGGEMTRVAAPLGPKGHLRFAPDGRYLAYIGREGRADWWKNERVWIVPLDGSEPARDLTGRYDFETTCDVINDQIGAAITMPPTWTPDGARLIFQVSRHGRCGLFSVDRQGEDLQPLIDRPGVVGVYTFDRAFRRLAYFFGSMTDPGQVFVRDLQRKRDRQITRLNRWLQRLDLGEVEEVWFKGADDNDLQGWILKPPGFDPNRQYPSILEIHGGPLTQYGHYFMHEFYFLAAQGYVVAFCNPRGGQGYGEDHARAIWGAWGSVDYQDLMAWADYVQSLPYTDPNRMGVTGGSYGGYMTTWIIGHTDRFKAAVAQRVVSNFVSFWGSSDFNWVFQQPIGAQAGPWSDLQRFWDQSPMKYIGNARTPTLLIHSEQDHRCPIEQGEQVFVALKTQGVETEMVRFPNEPHGLSRTGRTDRRIARLNHILRWFDRYLKA